MILIKLDSGLIDHVRDLSFLLIEQRILVVKRIKIVALIGIEDIVVSHLRTRPPRGLRLPLDMCNFLLLRVNSK